MEPRLKACTEYRKKTETATSPSPVPTIWWTSAH